MYTLMRGLESPRSYELFTTHGNWPITHIATLIRCFHYHMNVHASKRIGMPPSPLPLPCSQYMGLCLHLQPPDLRGYHHSAPTLHHVHAYIFSSQYHSASKQIANIHWLTLSARRSLPHSFLHFSSIVK